MRFDLLHPADQLVMMMSRIYYRGMTTTSGGNLSIKGFVAPPRLLALRWPRTLRELTRPDPIRTVNLYG